MNKSAVQSDIDLFSDETLANPYEAYQTLRDMGSAIYMKKVDAYFIGRFEDVNTALNNWQVFSSDKGIGLNPIINEAWQEALICQDPPVHTERRKIMDASLGPGAIRPLEETITERADQLIERLLTLKSFDGVVDFAYDLPLNVVMDLIGWPEDIKPSLIRIADGSWNAVGPDSQRMQLGLGQLQEMMTLLGDIYDKRRVVPGGFADQLINASLSGAIERDTAIGMLAGYIVAAFETTISAAASGLWLFANNPSEWDKLRTNPLLAAPASNEILRMESPLQHFARFVTDDVTMSDGSTIPANSWAIVSYASANRDERAFQHADRFIIDRRERLNLAFGAGPHRCAGQGLARMELKAIFGALADKVERIYMNGEPARGLNNISRSFSYMPVSIKPI